MLSRFTQLFKSNRPASHDSGLKKYIQGFLKHGADHMAALCELFTLECEEYSEAWKKRLILLALGFACLGLTYLSLWALLLIYLHGLCGLAIAVGIFVAVHALLSLILLIWGFATKPGPLAPMTRQELKTDLTCLQLNFKENSKP